MSERTALLEPWPPTTYMDRLEAVRCLIDRVDPCNDDETLHIVALHETWTNQDDAPFLAWDVGKRATIYVDFWDDGRVRVVTDANLPRWAVNSTQAARIRRVDTAMDGALLDALWDWDCGQWAHVIFKAIKS